MRAWRLSELGDPWDVLSLEQVESPSPGVGEARVEVSASDLNFADILQCQGQYQVRLNPPFTPGMSVAGTVVEVGPECDLRPGDRVLGMTASGWGGYAEEALVRGHDMRIVPSNVSLPAASAMNVIYATGWTALHRRGHMQPGETVLVLAAAGGVGSAAVQMAKVHGCTVIAAAGGSDKVEVCRSLGADVVVDYNSEDLYEKVMDATAGRGCDLIYDPVGGDFFDIARRLVAWEGRLLVVGFASGDIPSAPANHLLVKVARRSGQWGFFLQQLEPEFKLFANQTELVGGSPHDEEQYFFLPDLYVGERTEAWGYGPGTNISTRPLEQLRLSGEYRHGGVGADAHRNRDRRLCIFVGRRHARPDNDPVAQRIA